MAIESPTIVEGPTVQKIFFVSRFERPKGFSFEVDCCPGHPVNIVLKGRARKECGGRAYEPSAGTAVWYHEAERLQGRVVKAPWVFYSINFIAPLLPPPRFEHRFFRVPSWDILSMARGLVQMSRLTFSEIAERVGYGRVHELSRDYHKQFGVTPTADRAQYPRIYQREFGLPFTTDRQE